METGDRPIFATYKKREAKNVRFFINSLPLDSAEYCKASYEGGKREYLLRDKRWGNGELRVGVVAYTDHEGAIWKFETNGIDNVTKTGHVCNIKGTKFIRLGDIGTDDNPQESFSPILGEQPLQTASGTINDKNVLYFSLDDGALTVSNNKQLADKYNNADAYRAKLAGSVTFTTPDPYINPLGGAMVMA